MTRSGSSACGGPPVPIFCGILRPWPAERFGTQFPVQIIRFVDEEGRTCWGKPETAGHARPLLGDLFGKPVLAAACCVVKRRLPPVDPRNIIAIGRNYREHAREMKSQTPDAEPLIFLKATTSIVGPDDEIVLPGSAPSEVDFEAELAVVIGKTAKDITEAEAPDVIFGYTCSNDVSARDCQKRRDKQWTRGKSFDTFCPIGPVLVTADEVNPDRLSIQSRLNGVVMQDSNTREMIFPVAALVSYLSRQFTLPPGTLILTGTPAGVGSARTPPVFLRHGDEISVEIEGIGALSNRVRGPEP